MKKLILVYPPHSADPSGLYGQDRDWYPLGIAAIAAYIGKLNICEVVCLDLFNKTMPEALLAIKEELIEDGVNYVGFTLMTEQRHVVFDLIDDLTGPLISQDIRIIVGGPHASIMYDQILEVYPEIHHIVIGEGELATQYILTNEDPGRLVKGDPVDPIPSTFDGLKYFKEPLIKNQAPITLSRGCTANCTFCTTRKTFKKYRTRKAFEVLQEIANFIDMGIRDFKFHDDSATASKEVIMELCKGLEDKNIKFEMTARADQLDSEMIEALYMAGLYKIALGIESGSEKLRKTMAKQLDIEKARENIKILKRFGIHVHVLMIIGYPGETEQTIEETRLLLNEIKPSSFSNLPGLMVLPGTPVYNKLVREKWIDDRYWLRRSPPPYYTREHSLNKLLTFSDIIRMPNKKRIAIMAVVNQEEDVFKSYLESLDALEIPPYVEISRYFILHNSEGLAKYLQDGTYEIINDNLSHDFNHQWTYEKFEFMCNQKNKLVSIAKEAGADFIFWVDSDLILHSKTLTQLFHAGVGAIAEIFWTKWPNAETEMPNCWDADHYSFFGSFEKFREKGVFEVGGTGACMLVSTAIYSTRVNYTPIPNVSFSAWEDRAFCIRAMVNGNRLYIDTNYPATHLYTRELFDKWYNSNKGGVESE